MFLLGPRPVTFGDLATSSRAVASWLRERDVRPGSRMLIVAENHPDAVVAAMGAARAGVTFAFLHETTRPATLMEIAAQVDPACVVLDRTTASLRSVVNGLPLLVAGDAEIPGGTPVTSLRDRGPIEPVRADPLCLVYTSGSTGAPRGVMVTQDNVSFTTAAIQQRLRYRREDTIGLFVPLSFDYGLYQLFLALAAGAAVYVAPPGVAPLGLVDELERGRVTVLPGVPSLLTGLLTMLERSQSALPRLGMITNTGEALTAPMMDGLRKLLPQARVFPMYGLSECKRVSILLPEELERHPGSVGRPLDGTSVEIVDQDGSPVRDGAPGELVVRGPHVTDGYWRAPAETALRFAVDEDGTRVLRTGDICRRDAAGFLYFEGRADTQVKRRGFRISLLEIEAAASAVPGVVRAAAVSTPDHELHLFVETDPERVTSSNILRVLSDRLEPFKIPDRIHFVPVLPTTENGKLDRRSLRAQGQNA